MKNLVLADLAQEDIRNIYLYSLSEWGQKTATKYLHEMQNAFIRLTLHPDLGIVRKDLGENIFSLVINKHIIFYRKQIDCIEIARVLNGKQDPYLHYL